MRVLLGIKCLYLKQFKIHFQENIIDLMEYLKSINIKYSKTEIRFAIKLASLCETYPKMKLLSIPLRDLKANMKIVEEILTEDPVYWSN